MAEIEITDTKIVIRLEKSPIPPTRKALKNNGFSCRNTVWTAKRTHESEFFAKLLGGKIEQL